MSENQKFAVETMVEIGNEIEDGSVSGSALLEIEKMIDTLTQARRVGNTRRLQDFVVGICELPFHPVSSKVIGGVGGMAGREHEISMEEFHSRTEAGESSRDNGQPVIDAGDTHEPTSSIQEKFKKLKDAQAKVQLGTTPKIQKVLMLRDHKHYQKYCEPRVVSLGPIHHGKPKYQLTEEYKLMLAHEFIGRTGRTDEQLYGIVEENIKELREYYDKKVTQKYSDKELAWMLFVDGCATLQFIDLIVDGKVKDVKIKNDQVAFVKQDLFLLENQLPYQLFDYLMDSITEERRALKTKLRNSIQTFINKQSMLAEERISRNATNGIHLLDLLRKGLLGLDGVENNSAQNQDTTAEGDRHSVRNVQGRRELGLDGVENSSAQNQDTTAEGDRHSVRNVQGRRELGLDGVENNSAQNQDTTAEEDWHSFRNVQELREVGIRLKSSSSSCLREIKFTKKCNCYPGILQLPPITVDDSTVPMFFNLIAYEMCPDFENDFGITSYIFFLDSLIDDPKDVTDLRKAGILRNFLGSDQEVANVFNEIGTDLVPNLDIYRDVRGQIEKYYKRRSMTWISQFIHTHFSSPWTFIAFFAALFALGLAVVQTVYSILSYYNNKG